MKSTVDPNKSESLEYRLLAEGEIIREGDQFMDDSGIWRKTILSGNPAPNPDFSPHRQYRRYTTPKVG